MRSRTPVEELPFIHYQRREGKESVCIEIKYLGGCDGKKEKVPF